MRIVAPDAYDFIVIDGGTLVHSLPGTAVHCKIFYAYFEKVFCPRVHHDLKRSIRIGIVWDQYHPLTIKGATRETRGPGNRQRISGFTKVTGNWHTFLANTENKKKLFSYLSRKITEEQFPAEKDVYITAGSEVNHDGSSSPMQLCNHEEADTRVLVHLLHVCPSNIITRAEPLAGAVLVGKYLREVLILMVLSLFTKWRKSAPRRRRRRWRVKRRKFAPRRRKRRWRTKRRKFAPRRRKRKWSVKRRKPVTYRLFYFNNTMILM